MSALKRCVIVGGADINNYEYINSILLENDYLIYCDSGLKHMNKIKVAPSLIVGDFDSFDRIYTKIETIVLPCEKDDTDSVYAMKQGVERGFEEFLFLGVVGARFDHTFVNVSMLLYLDELGLKAELIDDYSVMSIVGSTPVKITDNYSYFSLLNITGKASGVCINNAKYTLDNAVIESEYQYATSNEVIKGKNADVSVNDGKLLLVKVF